MTALTRDLAFFALQNHSQDVPLVVRDLIRTRVAEAAGLAVANTPKPPADLMLRTLTGFSNSEEVGVLGRTERLGLCDAPIVTAVAILSGWQDLAFNSSALVDIDRGWPDGPIIAAALAVGEYTGATWGEVLDSLVLAIEIGLRIEGAMSPAFLTTGWIAGAVAARLGAAIVSGRLLNLNVEQMVSALGLAATQVAGVLEAETSPINSTVLGKAAGDGVEAAVLAQIGFDGPAAPIEGRRGLLEVLARGANDHQSIMVELGVKWRVSELTERGGRMGWLGDARSSDKAFNMQDQMDVSLLLAGSTHSNVE